MDFCGTQLGVREACGICYCSPAFEPYSNFTRQRQYDDHSVHSVKHPLPHDHGVHDYPMLPNAFFRRYVVRRRCGTRARPGRFPLQVGVQRASL
jgi:hypothetical protein